MSRNAISANPEHYIFKIFRGSMPPDPLEGLQKIFLAATWLKNFFRIDFPPNQKILDRTLEVLFQCGGFLDMQIRVQPLVIDCANEEAKMA